MAISLQAEVEHPLGLVLLGGNGPNDVFIETLRKGFGLDLGDESVLIRLADDRMQR
ncbi:hypothetical protein D3C85_1849340 [compost metagenome]